MKKLQPIISINSIFDSLNEESTLTDLERSATVAFPDTTKRQNALDTVRISQIKITAYVENNQIKVESVSKNVENGKTYDTEIMFTAVDFHDKKQNDYVTFMATNNKEYHISPLEADDNDVQVRCNCLDFYYRFATWNHNDDSLLGQLPKQYIKKAGSNRPPANPDRAPGLCKHLMKLADALHQSNMLKPS